jgi:hypothetical protein
VKAKTPRFLFNVRPHDSHGCYHLDVTVRTFWRIPQFLTTNTGRSALNLTWQANHDEPGRWYGFRLSVEDCDGAGTVLETWAPVLRKIGGANIPHAILEALEAHGAVQGDWSRLMGRHLPLDEMPAPGTRSYMDDGHDDGYCTVHAYVPPASIVDGAGTMAVARAFAEYVARNPSRMDRLEAWIANGKPVRYLEQEPEHAQPWRTLDGWRRILPAPVEVATA